MSIGRIMTLAEKLNAEDQALVAGFILAMASRGSVAATSSEPAKPVSKTTAWRRKNAAESDPQALHSHVYAVRAEGTRNVKIGVSRDVKARIAALQTASPHPLVLIGYFPGEESDERRLHRMLTHRHLRGEWFDFQEHEEVLGILFDHLEGCQS